MLQGKGVLDTQMPALPESVHAVPHVNECYDWGTFGWVGAGCRVQDAGCRMQGAGDVRVAGRSGVWAAMRRPPLPASRGAARSPASVLITLLHSLLHSVAPAGH